jgi:phage-related protein (TIGR01555 family)
MNKPLNARNDGFMNVLSGMSAANANGDISARAWAGRRSNYTYAEAYMTNGLAQKIIDRPADDAFQRGITIENDEDEVMSAEFDRLQVLAKMADAVRWSRLCGGSALLLIAKDGGEFTDPLNLDSLESVEEIKVLDANCIRGTDRYYTDPNDSETYGKLEFYSITCPGKNAFDVHETRLIPMGGEPIPYGITAYNRVHWIGRSALESCYTDLVRYGLGLEWSLRLLERKQQAVYAMQGLGEMFAQGMDNVVKERINLVDVVRGNLNSVVIDKDDTYVIQTPGMDGVDSAIQEYQTALAAASNMPVTILFGKSTTGLNQTGAGDLEAYYGMVSKIQNVIARPPFEKLVSVLWVQSSIKGKIPDDWKIVYNPLWVLNDVELAQSQLATQQANTAEVAMLVSLMDNQIISPEEIRKIVVDKYPEYEFPEDIPDSIGEVDYAEGVDPLMMAVPVDPDDPDAAPPPSVPPGRNPNAFQK